ncbi:MAG: polysaccharide biosynthesis tyrosine autokinase [Bacteroidales bacterium]|nr:polysaccharide biosynthesis tyrosine autokinase [Bacteroidales bacterium]
MQKKSESQELLQLINKYSHYWKWILVSVILCLTLSVIYIKIKSPVFQFYSNVLIKEEEDSPSSSASSLMKGLSFNLGGAQEVRDELYVISSFSLLRQVVNELELYKSFYEKKYFVKVIDCDGASAIDIDFDKSISDTLNTSLKFDIHINKKGETSVKVKSLGETIFKEKNMKLPAIVKTNYGIFTITQTELFAKNKSYSYSVYINGADYSTENLSDLLSVYFVDKKANVIQLAIKGSNIEKSKSVLNKLMELYNKEALNDKNISALATAQFINTRLDLLSKQLNQAETDIEKFKKDNNIFDLELESKASLSMQGEMQVKYFEAKTQLSILDEIESYLSADGNKFSLLPASLASEDKNLSLAIENYNTIVLERINLLKGATQQNPLVASLSSQIEALRNNVLTAVANVKKSALITCGEFEKQQDNFATKYDMAPSIEKQFIELKRIQVIKDKLVTFLLQKKEENELTQAVNTPKARIIDYAYRINKPISPNKKLLILFALFAGVIIPVMVIYVLQVLKITFSSKKELEEITELPVLGEISKKDCSDNIVVRDNASSSVAELFRLARTNIQFLLSQKNQKIILVTSTKGGEGKTFFAINIALSLALANKRIAVIGLDIRKPKLGEYINCNDADKGVTNYLSDDNISMDSIVRKNLISKNVDFILSGPVPPNPNELLLNERLSLLFEMLKNEYDYIIIDSAPVGMVSDTFSLTQYADLTLYVTRVDYTSKENIKFAEQLVDEHKLNRVYFVVNGTTTKQGYGYGYGK